MLHVTCDGCGKEVLCGEHHYVVKMEAFAVHDPNELQEDDLDQDHLDAVSELLREIEENPESYEAAAPFQQFRYDLCTDCHAKFLLDPLGRNNMQNLNFSKN